MNAPGLSSRRDYQPSWLLADVIAGVTVAAVDSSPLLADYDITSGRIWLLVPIWVAIGPTVVRRLRVNLSGSADLNHRT